MSATNPIVIAASFRTPTPYLTALRLYVFMGVAILHLELTQGDGVIQLYKATDSRTAPFQLPQCLMARTDSAES
jgi:hypothetical protein